MTDLADTEDAGPETTAVGFVHKGEALSLRSGI
jgi:hypothetical protein